MNEYILQALHLSKSVPLASGELHILKDIHLQVRAGEAVVIVGPSGSGKSTLLHLLGSLDRPSAGEIFFRNQKLSEKSDAELASFRNAKMGFVFQFHHLLPEMTCLENVMMPGRIAGLSPAEVRPEAEALLQKLGLGERLHYYPNQLSGGELQRTSIARALVRKPEILFADEPTGNLDTANGQQIQNLFFQLKESLGLTLITVTHDERFARRFQRILRLLDGRWAS
ncbi:MAG: ABC transporter ATP-binding protein [Bdellovibrio sp.]